MTRRESVLEFRNTLYTALGQPERLALQGLNEPVNGLVLAHEIRYDWNPHGQLAGVTSPAGKFQYEYDPASPALLTTMTGPAHSVETTYEPHRNLITGVRDRSIGILSVNRAGTPDPAPDAHTNTTTTTRQDPKSKITDEVRTLQGAAPARPYRHRYPAYDANGNIGQLLDEAGEVVAAYAYDPFGNVTEMAGEEAAENPWRFSTKPVEEVTGWSYYGYRWYDAEMGRWVNRDPIEEAGGVNLYGFVGNNGVGEIDVLGLQSPRKGPCCPGKTEKCAWGQGCCESECYTKRDECCRDGQIIDREPVPTGISRVYAAPGRFNPFNHGGLQGPDWGPRGVQKTGDDIPGTNSVWDANDPQLDRNRNSYPVKLSECDYDIPKFAECVRSSTQGGTPVDFRCVSNNCRRNLEAVISRCMAQSKLQ